MKVLWLTKGLGPGGAERLLLSFAKLGDHLQFEFHAAYLLPWKDHLVDELQHAGVTVHCLGAASPYDLRWLVRLRRLVREQEIEIVHNHSPLVAAQARITLRGPPVGRSAVLIGTEHNMWSSHHALTRHLNRLTLPLEQHTFAVSAQVKASMPPPQSARVELLVHGVDVDSIADRRREREAARGRLGLDPDALVVVTVANLRANKDYPTLLRAARLLMEGGENITFLSVGQGPLEAQLLELRDDLGLGDCFTFLGHENDPISVLVAGDVFCLSSRYEGLPIALLEAMALSLPIVATNIGGIPTAVTHGVEGILIHPGKPATLAHALVALKDPEQRNAMATAAGCRSRSFDIRPAIDRQQQAYLEFYGAKGLPHD